MINGNRGVGMKRAVVTGALVSGASVPLSIAFGLDVVMTMLVAMAIIATGALVAIGVSASTPPERVDVVEDNTIHRRTIRSHNLLRYWAVATVTMTAICIWGLPSSTSAEAFVRFVATEMGIAIGVTRMSMLLIDNLNARLDGGRDGG